MGKIQCVGINYMSLELIERSLMNVNTPLEKKINEEYYTLKKLVKEHAHHSTSAKNLKFKNSNQEGPMPYLESYTNTKKRLERFMKWYKMATHSDGCSNNGGGKEINSSILLTNTSTNSNNSYHNQFHSNCNNQTPTKESNLQIICKSQNALQY